MGRLDRHEYDSDSDDLDVTTSILPNDDSDLDSDTDSGSRTKLTRGKGPRVKSKGNELDLDFDDLDQESEDELKALITKKKKTSSGGFQAMGLSPFLLKAIQRKGFKIPTPIQRKSIPLIMEGVDIVGMARTGSGKTAAFVIPLIEKLKAHSAIVGARGLIFSPNRELAFQTAKVVSELCKGTDIRSIAIVGGESMEDQFNFLAGNPDIIIATPGRLLHLIVEADLDLKTIEYVVFDECDRLFEMGFDVQLRELLARLPPTRQSLLFSATLPKNLVEFAKAGLQDPTLVRLDVDTKISDDLEMAFFKVKQEIKEASLLYLLREVIHCPKASEIERPTKGGSDNLKRKGGKKSRKEASKSLYPNQSIIFVSTKHHVEYIATLLEQAGYDVGKLYGSMDQTARQIQINQFRSQEVPLFVVTDVAARGIDIPILENVINYDFVDQSKVFIHRVGRVARAGKRGWAYSFVTVDELAYFNDLQLFLGRPIITAAQVTPEISDNIDYTKDLVIGALASDTSLVDDNEWLHARIAHDVELEGMRKVSINGSKMFRKSRRAVVAARESHQRAKEQTRSGHMDEIHPLLAKNIKPEDASANEFLKGISNFKPKETIFEVGARGIKKQTPASEAIKARRVGMDEKIVNYRTKQTVLKTTLTPAKLASTLGDSVAMDELETIFKVSNTKARSTAKDEENYISYYQKDAHTERGYSLQGGSFAQQTMHATLDMTGDDKLTQQHKQNQLRWDKKKKKFVKGDGTGSDNKKLLKTESGNKIAASFKSGTFNDWQRKHGIDLPRAGESELASGKQKLLDAKNKRQFKHHTKAKEDGDRSNKRAKSELKSVVEIRKDRETKDRRREKTGRHHIAGSKGKGRKKH